MEQKIHNDLCVGIDLGTTNSAAAVVQSTNKGIKTPVMKINRYVKTNAKEKNELLPSVVYYDGDDIYVGDLGKTVRISQPYKVISSVKSYMGEKKLPIDSLNIKDTTPEEVSARILSHILNSIKDAYGETEPIRDVVITVPANFQFEKRQATMRAAELAGIYVRKDENGLYNDDELLLSEPQAVVYCFINETANGEIESRIDFSQPKNILVFDIGGGTLDITLHNIVSDDNEKFKIEAIATNRFSNIAGDKFDDAIVDELFSRYYKNINKVLPDAAKDVMKNEEKLKREIKPYAEVLKCDVSSKYDMMQMRGKSMSPDMEFDCTARLSNGYQLDEIVTFEEFETIIEPLMGYGYNYDDYKRFSSITESDNIIYPILDVLAKAKAKLGDDVKIDGVILNGGMSKLYCIPKRLEQFFGFKPIMVTDPDKSVAKGAAVYHYYQHQSANSIMNNIGFDDYAPSQNMSAASQKAPSMSIVSSGDVLPETIYLGLKGGGTYPLVEAGTNLPYTSDIITGFGLDKYQTFTTFPLMREVKKGSFETIARGSIRFDVNSKFERKVAMRFTVNKNQILTFTAWTCNNEDGSDEIQKGYVYIDLGTFTESKAAKGKMNAPSGVRVPVSALSQLKNLCVNEYDRSVKRGNAKERNKVLDNIRSQKALIAACGNKSDFAEPILKDLGTLMINNRYLTSLFTLARKLAPEWTTVQQTRLATACKRRLNTNLKYQREGMGFGEDTNLIIETLQTFGRVGSKKEVEDLVLEYEQNKSLRSAILYCYSWAGVREDWIYNCFKSDFNSGKSIQESVKAITIVLKNGADYESINKHELTEMLMQIVSGELEYNLNEQVLATVALGVCGSLEKDESRRLEFEETLDTINFAPQKVREHLAKAYSVAMALVQKKNISEEDEQYMLKLLDN